jgi:hypothetical protein
MRMLGLDGCVATYLENSPIDFVEAAAAGALDPAPPEVTAAIGVPSGYFAPTALSSWLSDMFTRYDGDCGGL